MENESLITLHYFNSTSHTKKEHKALYKINIQFDPEAHRHCKIGLMRPPADKFCKSSMVHHSFLKDQKEEHHKLIPTGYKSMD